MTNYDSLDFSCLQVNLSWQQSNWWANMNSKIQMTCGNNSNSNNYQAEHNSDMAHYAVTCIHCLGSAVDDLSPSCSA